MEESAECRDMILSEDSREFIINSRRESPLDRVLEEKGECRKYLGSTFYQVSLPGKISAGLDLSQFPYYAVPKCYTLQDMAMISQAGIGPIQNYPGLELQGSGVLVGFVDTGIDYTNPVFKTLGGRTRILEIWDQTIQGGTPPEQFGYGTVYTKEDIDAALQSADPAEIVPSRDENGHGTFMASVACGSPDAENRFSGAAPMSSLAVVKLKPAKQYLREYYRIKEGAECYQETDIMAGIRYLDELARSSQMPLVLCLGLGTNMGSHTGASPLGRVLEEMAVTARRAVVAGTGNEAEKRHHYRGELKEPGQIVEVEIKTGKENRGFWMELWTDIPNILEVGILSPSGEYAGNVSLRENPAVYRFVFEQTTVNISTRLLVEGTSAEMFSLRFENPAEGIWKLRVRAVRVGSGIFHLWLPVTEFMGSDTYFLASSPDTTITEPGNAFDIMTCAWYNGGDQAIAISSGRGYTREERIKPDFAAPGEEVTGAGTAGRFVQRSGSSVGTAVTAGASALLLEWLAVRSGQNVNSVQIKSLLIAGTQRRPGVSYPNREWGYGTLNLYQTFEELRQY